MARHAGTALHGKARRLVEDEDLRVLVEQHLAQHIAVVLAAHGLRRELAFALAVDAERGDAHDLSRFDAGVCLGATAVDAHLAGAQQLLQLHEAEAGIMRLEPAVEPHARLARFDRDLLYACHCLSCPETGALIIRWRS